MFSVHQAQEGVRCSHCLRLQTLHWHFDACYRVYFIIHSTWRSVNQPGISVFLAFQAPSLPWNSCPCCSPSTWGGVNPIMLAQHCKETPRLERPIIFSVSGSELCSGLNIWHWWRHPEEPDAHIFGLEAKKTVVPLVFLLPHNIFWNSLCRRVMNTSGFRTWFLRTGKKTHLSIFETKMCFKYIAINHRWCKVTGIPWKGNSNYTQRERQRLGERRLPVTFKINNIFLTVRKMYTVLFCICHTLVHFLYLINFTCK